MVRGRCRSTRQCDYCARLAAVEWCELLGLDALHGIAPTVYAVLTTAETKPDLGTVKDAKKAIVQAVRERWPGAQYVCIVEFTTGRSKQSRGRRFPHWNWLWKGIPAGDVAELRAVMFDHWQRHVEAAEAAQHVGTVYSAGGLMRYLALHFMKEDQRPPRWWHGHRVTRSRGYLWAPTTEARAVTRESLTFKRELRKAIAAGYAPEEAGAVAEAATFTALRTAWECVELSVDFETGETLRPPRPLSGRDTIRRPVRVRRGHGTIAEWETLEAHLAAEVAQEAVQAPAWASERPSRLFEPPSPRRDS